ncbi:CAP domain-containing protein, partial [Streptomyces sp. NPDC059552]
MGRHRLPTAPHSGGKRGTALRTGLLGVSVAVALGTAAVTTGMVPVGGSFPYVGVSGTDAPTAAPRAKASADPDAALRGLANLSGRASASTGPGTASPSRPASPSPSPSASASPSPSGSPSASPTPPPPESAAPTPAAPPPAPHAPPPRGRWRWGGPETARPPPPSERH